MVVSRKGPAGCYWMIFISEPPSLLYWQLPQPTLRRRLAFYCVIKTLTSSSRTQTGGLWCPSMCKGPWFFKRWEGAKAATQIPKILSIKGDKQITFTFNLCRLQQAPGDAGSPTQPSAGVHKACNLQNKLLQSTSWKTKCFTFTLFEDSQSQGALYTGQMLCEISWG